MTPPGMLALAGWLACLGLLTGGELHRRGRRRRLARSLHELRGPLSTLALGLESARRRGALATEQLEGLELSVRRAAVALGDLEAVGHAHGMPRLGGRARTSAGQSVEAPVAGVPLVDVPGLLRGCAREAATGAPGRAVRFDVTRAGGVAVRGDRVRLAQAVGNLLANAIEHGTGVVTVSARSSGAEVRIEVGDEGPGLTESLACLRRRRRRRCRRGGGGGPRGHGLGIVEEIARAHGGELRSAPSARGARLVLVLPLLAARSGAGDGRAPQHASHLIPPLTAHRSDGTA